MRDGNIKVIQARGSVLSIRTDMQKYDVCLGRVSSLVWLEGIAVDFEHFLG